MIKSFAALFNRPFPGNDDLSHAIKGSAGIGVFVALFLFIFLPFGLHRNDQNTGLICLGFGLITIFISTVYSWLTLHVFKSTHETAEWTFGKWIISTVSLILCISIGNFLFYLLFSGDSPTVGSFLMLVYNTLAIALIPICFVGYSRLVKAEKYYSGVAKEMKAALSVPAQGHLVEITDQKDETHFFESRDVIAIEALQNYIKVIYDPGGELKHSVLRMTMKDVELQLRDPDIMRCHRSYFVNRRRIASVRGNAQGLLLTVSDNPAISIPVSRKYVDQFRHV